jgi:flagella synthesis protein FlgN
MQVSASKSSISFGQDMLLVQQLKLDLQSEQTALIAADIDTLEKLINKRLNLLQQLSAAAKNRYDALTTLGFQANEQGMSDWLKAQANPALTQQWLDFQKALVESKEMNRLNGVLISKHFHRNQQILNQLQGSQAKANVYGKNGQAQSHQYLRNALTV